MTKYQVRNCVIDICCYMKNVCSINDLQKRDFKLKFALANTPMSVRMMPPSSYY